MRVTEHTINAVEKLHGFAPHKFTIDTESDITSLQYDDIYKTKRSYFFRCFTGCFSRKTLRSRIIYTVARTVSETKRFPAENTPLSKRNSGSYSKSFFSQISISTSGLYHQRVNTACVPFRSAAAATAALERTATSNQFKRLQLNTDYDDDIKHRMDETGQVSDTGNSVNDLTVTYPAPSTSTVCVPSKPRNSWHNPRG